MPTPSSPLPTTGQNNSTEDPKTRAALAELQTILTAGVDSSNLASLAVITANLANLAVTTGKIADAGVTDAKLATRIVRGKISSSGTIVAGTGFTMGPHSAPGDPYTINFTVAFAAEPAVVMSTSSQGVFVWGSSSPSALTVFATNVSNVGVNAAFDFIAVSV